MQDAGTVLEVLRERGRKGLPCDELYRQMFNKELYLLAYGNVYSNQGAMTPGAGGETADGMSEDRIDEIIGRSFPFFFGIYTRRAGANRYRSKRISSMIWSILPSDMPSAVSLPAPGVIAPWLA